MAINTDFILAQLQRRRDEAQLQRVAAGTGLTARTLHNVLNGKPITMTTATKLQDYLHANQHVRKLEDARKQAK